MYNYPTQAHNQPSINFNISGLTITAKFSDDETRNVKENIIDILTATHEMRMQQAIIDSALSCRKMYE